MVTRKFGYSSRLGSPHHLHTELQELNKLNVKNKHLLQKIKFWHSKTEQTRCFPTARGLLQAREVNSRAGSKWLIHTTNRFAGKEPTLREVRTHLLSPWLLPSPSHPVSQARHTTRTYFKILIPTEPYHDFLFTYWLGFYFLWKYFFFCSWCMTLSFVVFFLVSLFLLLYF